IDTVLCETNVLRLGGKDYTPGFYEFRLNNPTGCDTIVQIKLAKATTNPKLHLNPVPRDTTIQMGDSLTLQLKPNFKPIAIHWDSMAWMSCKTCLAPLVKPFIDQKYFVAAQDSQKCVMRDTVLVKVKRGYYEIPNAFYPDRGAAYTVHPDKAIQSIDRLRIYDRWGTLIYDSQTNTADWNGKFHDELVPAGVYVVLLEATLKNGQPEKRTSDLTIIR
ncbi:MAG: hypothetical protein RLZZ628_3703, partial [Bacteroidota bacterium]